MTIKKRVLIGSPIHQKPSILKEFFDVLSKVALTTIEADYFFYDDNAEEASSALIEEFAKTKDHCIIRQSDHSGPKYVVDEETHMWNNDLSEKVARFKDEMIAYALANQYDYLFLVDSDLLIHPRTIEHLLQANQNIVSEIYWTSWRQNEAPLPNVWLSDQYTLYHQEKGETLSIIQKLIRTNKFLSSLKKKGLYQVGGLGACTLISNKALAAGVKFERVKGLSLTGEDRYFCHRAVEKGFSLFVDTHYPAYHIYRESDLKGVAQFKEKCGLVSAHTDTNPSSIASIRTHIPKKENTITLSMVMKNEANNYLQRVLEDAKQYIDAAVIIDDNSDDNSVEMCRDILQDIPLQLVENSTSTFTNEIDLRKQQWQETVKTNPGWILNLDADEVFEECFKDDVHTLIAGEGCDVICFRLYDFWNETHYREDQFWCAHFTYRPFLVKYNPDERYTWQETPIHCGRFPNNILTTKVKKSDLRLKHFGWANEANRIRKYDRYITSDPHGKYGWLAQYHSIMDPNPQLIKWKE